MILPYLNDLCRRKLMNKDIRKIIIVIPIAVKHVTLSSSLLASSLTSKTLTIYIYTYTHSLSLFLSHVI